MPEYNYETSAPNTGQAIQQLALVAASPVGGNQLVNGTPVFLSWTAPNDGKLHFAIAAASLRVDVAEVAGGQVNFSTLVPGGAIANQPLFSSAQGISSQTSFGPMAVVPPGGTVTVNQAAALTGAGTAFLFAGIWGA